MIGHVAPRWGSLAAYVWISYVLSILSSMLSILYSLCSLLSSLFCIMSSLLYYRLSHISCVFSLLSPIEGPNPFLAIPPLEGICCGLYWDLLSHIYIYIYILSSPHRGAEALIGHAAPAPLLAAHCLGADPFVTMPPSVRSTHSLDSLVPRSHLLLLDSHLSLRTSHCALPTSHSLLLTSHFSLPWVLATGFSLLTPQGAGH